MSYLLENKIYFYTNNFCTLASNSTRKQLHSHVPSLIISN